MNSRVRVDIALRPQGVLLRVQEEGRGTTEIGFTPVDARDVGQGLIGAAAVAEFLARQDHGQKPAPTDPPLIHRPGSGD